MTLAHVFHALDSLDAWNVAADTGGMRNHLMTAVRDELRERREVRAREHELRRELSAYTAPAEIDDLLATLEHHEEQGTEVEDTALIRRILLQNLRTHYAREAAPQRTVAGL